MLNASRAITLSAGSAPELPRVKGLEPLYRWGCRPRQGELIMVAGRSGMQKSGFVMWWVSQMNLPTLYLSADMSLYGASVRFAGTRLGWNQYEVEAAMAEGGEKAQVILDELADVNVTLVPGAITIPKIDAAIGAFIEQTNNYPAILVVDNLMDIEGSTSDYTEQMEAMQILHDLGRETGMTIFVLHHATDKGWAAQSNPYYPPARSEIKGGMSEKPELVLTVALEPTTNFFRIAVTKQRMGRQDATAQNPVIMQAYPEVTQFGPIEPGTFVPTD